MQKALAILAVTITLSGCAGRHAEPIAANYATDSRLSCIRIVDEIAKHQQKLISLQAERSRINRRNINVGIAGSFLLIPLFWLNVTDAPEVEQYAIGGRLNVLNDLRDSKNCN